MFFNAPQPLISFKCQSCSSCILPNEYSSSEEYIFIKQKIFKDPELKCKNCGAKINMRLCLLDFLKNNFMNSSALALINNSQMMATTIKLKEGEIKKINLSEYGIPKKAKIYGLNISSYSFELSPVLFHGNDAMINQVANTDFHKGLSICTSRTREGVETEYKSGLCISYVPETTDVSEMSMINALMVFCEKSYLRHEPNAEFNDIIVPLNIAIESKLSSVLYPYISNIISNQKTKEFFDNNNYGHLINHIVPILCSSLNIRPMDKVVQGQVNRIRNLRNDMSHKGKPREQISFEVACNLLTDGFLAYKYISNGLKEGLDINIGRD